MWMDFSGYGISFEKKLMIGFIIGQMFCCRMVNVWGRRTRFSSSRIPSPRPMIKEAFERIAKEFEDLN